MLFDIQTLLYIHFLYNDTEVFSYSIRGVNEKFILKKFLKFFFRKQFLRLNRKFLNDKWTFPYYVHYTVNFITLITDEGLTTHQGLNVHKIGLLISLCLKVISNSRTDLYTIIKQLILRNSVDSVGKPCAKIFYNFKDFNAMPQKKRMPGLHMFDKEFSEYKYCCESYRLNTVFIGNKSSN